LSICEYSQIDVSSIVAFAEVIPLDTVERIFNLADAKFDEQRKFAAELGIDPTIPSRWRKRKSNSYQKYLPQIAETLGTSTEYLLTGKEPAIPNGVIIRVGNRNTISAEARQVAFAYDDASPELQAAVRRVLGIK